MAASIPEFRNEPFTEWTPESRRAFEAALKEVRAKSGKTHAMWVDGKEITDRPLFDSTDPSEPTHVVGRFPLATVEDADRAIDGAVRAFPAWSRRTFEERAGFLFEAAKRMRARKHHFSARMVYEVGKNFAEADGDTAEAIDFLEFYAREALRYGAGAPVTPVAGENNELVYLPLGAGAVIPPWNFPLAITVGMTSAALVTGNTVVLKPASESPAIASDFVTLMREVGIPAGVLQFLTGSGALIGDRLVTSPKIRFVSFTGSKEVGIGIHEKAAKVAPGQIWLKRTVLEMGGKDAIVVDRDADLDAAAKGVAQSAFGYQGQKCSACSRAIVDAKVYDAFLEKLKKEVEAIDVGPAERNHRVGPVVSERARKKILEYVEKGKREGRVLAGGGPAPGPGWFVAPTVIADVAENATIAQEEIFGPVLAVIRAKDFEDALRIANGTEYGLTGAVYSRDESKLAKAREEFFVGNLYLNRKCTGALVGAHPFGGFNMSGTDSKAGGRDYLGLFLQAKSVSRRTG
ncbi:MAG TPA: L-glutamate gamma-semialdehyde dehydrogenase [Planctomycetota bacterium]|nr:L-glutamate gamma-semialdehyde dehydrogenase [Planctomycetota bacterium]